MSVDRDKVLQVAQKLVDKKRYDKAIEEYRKLVRDDPGDVRTLLKIGDLHLKLDQHEDAIRTYEQVGDYYYREGFSVKAIAVYKQIRGIIQRYAIHLEGRYGHIVPRLAEIYTQLGLTSDALAAYDEVATRLRKEGRERDALDIFKKVLEIDPRNPIAHLRVADSRARLGDLDKAVERFGEAARIMVKLGRHDDALKVLERLLEYRQEPEYARMAAELYLGRNGPNDGMTALAKLQLCFKADPKDLATLAILARAFDAIKQPRKAIEVLKESARVAKEKGDNDALHALVDTLAARAPEDNFVKQLVSQQQAVVHVPHADSAPEIDSIADIDIVEADSFIEESLESISEVFELDDNDLHSLDWDESEKPVAVSIQGQSGRNEPEAIRKLNAEVERLEGEQKLDEAIAKLGAALREWGSNGVLRQKLSDLLLQTGDQPGAIAEKLLYARELAQEGKLDQASEILDEVSLIEPRNTEAANLRTALGMAPPTGYTGNAQQEAVFGQLQLDGPLQSYDVESGGVDQVLNRTTPSGRPIAPEMSTGVDEPFASSPGASSAGGGSAAALDEDALERADSYIEQGWLDEAKRILTAQLARLPDHPLLVERLAEIDRLATRGSLNPAAPFAQGGYPDAPRPSYPGGPYYAGQDGYPSTPHPYSGYAPAAPGYGGAPHSAYPTSTPYPTSGPYSQYPSTASGPQSPRVSYAPPIGAEHLPPSTPSYQPGAGYAQSVRSQYPEVGPVLDQFKAGVRAQVPDSDASTHYDLGVAYNEMGLYADAISELTLAARDPRRQCVCLSMIGTIHLQLGELDTGLDALHRALESTHKTREQELALGYEIANAYEMKRMPEQALQYFEWVAQIDANYSDPRGHISARIQKLRAGSGTQRKPQPPNSQPDEDDVGAAIDDLFSKPR